MRRKAVAALFAAAMGGCMSFQPGPETGGGGNVPHWGKAYGPPTVPGVQGPYGSAVPMAAPYSSAPPPTNYMARAMLGQSVPLNSVQMNNPAAAMGALPPGAMVPPTPVPPGGILSPPGMPFAPGAPGGVNVPPMFPGGMPGRVPPGLMQTGGLQPANMPMGGGVINANIPPGFAPPGGVVQTQLAQANPASSIRFQGQRTQIRFVRPSGMKVSWFTQGPDGKPAFSTTPIEAPGRYNFPQAAIYRIKLSNIEGRPGLEVYPTMEVVPSNPKTEAFLAHSAVPIEFTNEDFKQVSEGNYLVKVIYLPDPQFQDVAGTGTDEILSTRLEPGADPIQEALRRGSILVVLRMGNVDQEAPNTPPLNQPGPQAQPPMFGPGMMPPPGLQVPFMGMRPGMPMMGPMGPMGPGGPMPGFAGLPPGGMNPNQMPPNGPPNMPGPLNIPSTPLSGNVPPPPPVSAVPNPLPNGLEVSTPKGPVPTAPGTSSTSKFQDTPPVPPPPPGVAPRDNGPAFPPTPGNVQLPAPPGTPGQADGPSMPAVPLSRVPEVPGPAVVPAR